MIHGTPHEAHWLRPEPRRSLPADVLKKIVEAAFPRHTAVDLQPLLEGYRNANFRLRLDGANEFMILRMYEHDPSLCRKEVDLLNLIKSRVPVPEVIYAEPDGMNEIPPFVFLRYVEGIAFRELKNQEDKDSISEGAYEAGKILASIGRTTFPESGWLGPGPRVTASLLEGAYPGPRFVDLCLACENALQRVKTNLRDQISALVWSHATQLASLDEETNLVHGDFGKRNLLMRKVGGTWGVAAVLDWEFAIAGSPLFDVGHFLRYESSSRPRLEPHFSNGYIEAGGRLNGEWRRLARVLDLIALCDSLTHDALPTSVVDELIELVTATVENRDPQCEF